MRAHRLPLPGLAAVQTSRGSQLHFDSLPTERYFAPCSFHGPPNKRLLKRDVRKVLRTNVLSPSAFTQALFLTGKYLLASQSGSFTGSPFELQTPSPVVAPGVTVGKHSWSGMIMMGNFRVSFGGLFGMVLFISISSSR